MSEKLPVIRSAELVKVVEKKGFVKVRQSGSHAIYRHSDGRRTTIPIHSGKSIGKGLLKQIMKDAELSVEDIRVK